MELRAAQTEVEAISRAYARIHGIDRTDDWLLLKLGEEIGELTQAHLAQTGRSRRSATEADVADELADVLAHVLLIAERRGVDLSSALESKWGQWRHLVIEQDRSGPARSPGVGTAEGDRS